jgi:hypothetical protein
MSDHDQEASHSGVIARIKSSLGNEIDRLRKVQEYNLSTLRKQPWSELSGSMGDLGTYIPIFVALGSDFQHAPQISISSTLVFNGIFNILTGLYFGLPLPVQPMKAIAAVALLNPNFSPEMVASGGLLVAGVIFLLSISRMLNWFTRVVPIPIVKGIQVATGLSLVIASFKLIPAPQNRFLGLDILFLFFISTRRQFPFILVIVIGGGLIGTIVYLIKWQTDHSLKNPFSIWQPTPLNINLEDFYEGSWNLGLGQIPLTTLNSIIAVVFLLEDILPHRQTPSAQSIGLSVSFMNLVGCWFGAMPVCHGSGGLAAQYRFGARSGASVIFLGLLKLLLGLLASDLAIMGADKFPRMTLAVFLFLAGVELVKQGEGVNAENARDLQLPASDEPGELGRVTTKELTDIQKRRRWAVMLVTIGVTLGSKNDGLGVVGGYCCHIGYILSDKFERKVATFWEMRQRRREGRIRLEEDNAPSER